MRRLLPIGLLATTGCAGTLPICLPEEDRTPELRAVVLEAGEMLGLRVHFTTGGYGAVVLDLVDRAGTRIAGHSLVEHGCRRAAWSLAEPHIVAHELGHVLGLEHQDELENLMNMSAPHDAVLEQWQLDEVEREAGLLEACAVEVE